MACCGDLSADRIEKVLTDPNWAEIFGHIARLARLTAIDLSKVFSVTAAAGISNQILESQEALSNLFTIDEKKVASTNKEKVTTIFDELQKSIMQQTARVQLEGMTNSEGLINMILGREDWLSLWIKIKKINIFSKVFV